MSNKIKVAHMTTVHNPKDTRIFYRECLTLFENNFDVYLISRSTKESLFPVKSVQIPHVGVKHLRILFSPLLAFTSSIRLNCKIYHIHDPELIPVGFLLKTLGKSVIYDVHEEYAKFFSEKEWVPVQIRRLLAKIYTILETLACKKFDAVIAATPKIAEGLKTQSKFTIHNYPRRGELSRRDYDPATRENKLIYTGNITIIRGIKEMVNMIGIVNQRSNIGTIKLVICGDFSPEEVRKEVSELDGWKYVEYLGYLDRDILAEEMNKCKIGLAILHPTSNHVESIPNKLFEYMSMGLPIVCSNFTTWHNIVENGECGHSVDPFAIETMADTVLKMMQNNDILQKMSNKSISLFNEKYNWDSESENLIKCYNYVLKDESSNMNALDKVKI